MTTPIQNQADENTTRWFIASLTDHFADVINASIALAPPFSVTGYSLNSDENQDHIEMRIQGPYEKDIPGWLVFEVPLSFLITFRQGGAKDMFTIDRWIGVYKDALRKPIEIFKSGSGSDDDNTLLGCLTPKVSKRELIRCDRYGFVDGNVPVQQATIVATLDTWLPWS